MVEVEVVGPLDLCTVERTRAQLVEALELNPSCLLVDLSACSFFDATGISMLLEIHRRAWRQHASLVLRGCSARHLRLLALMGLIGVFDTGEAVETGSGRD
jgi:anti-sigma B factor antagonist